MLAKRILICDDEPTMRELVRVVLGDAYEFSEAADGFECAELARELKPDVLVLDMMMPGRTGLEVLHALREDQELSQLRVAVITAWDHLEAKALAAGADRFFVKPFEPDEFAKAIAELLTAG
jgi:CheY-like chemotaxis protein